MVTVLALLGVVLVLFAAAALSTRDGAVLADAPPDAADVALPAGPVQPEDVAALRFSLAPRGYRMSEVDEVLDRLAAELADRDRRLALLEAALEGGSAPAPDEPAAAPVVDVVEAGEQDLPVARPREPWSSPVPGDPPAQGSARVAPAVPAVSAPQAPPAAPAAVGTTAPHDDVATDRPVREPVPADVPSAEPAVPSGSADAGVAVPSAAETAAAPGVGYLAGETAGPASEAAAAGPVAIEPVAADRPDPVDVVPPAPAGAEPEPADLPATAGPATGHPAAPAVTPPAPDDAHQAPVPPALEDPAVHGSAEPATEHQAAADRPH